MTTALSPSWAQLIDGYMLAENANGMRPETQRVRRCILRRIGSDIGCTPAELTVNAWDAWFGSQAGWAIETRRAYRNTIVSFTRWAHNAGHLPSALALASIAHPKVRARPAPDDAWRTALTAADSRTTLMLRLAAELGLRRAEIAQVHCNDLLPGPQLLVHGKGGKDRVLPVSDDIAAQISAGPAGYGSTRTCGGWLFPSRQGGHLTPNMVGNLISEALPDRWTAHTLRHRFASRAYRGTRNLRAVQELLGHASVATTERYTAVDDDEMRAAMMFALDSEPAR